MSKAGTMSISVEHSRNQETISVSTTDGRVTLSGNVANARLIGKAMALALETDGVREVSSTLKVK